MRLVALILLACLSGCPLIEASDCHPRYQRVCEGAQHPGEDNR